MSCAGNLPQPGGLCPVWVGVECDAATQRVVGINVSSVQLCSAPPCPLPITLLQAVSALRVLRLPATGVTMQLAQLAQVSLPLLRQLDLGDNPGVEGPLPHALPIAMPRLTHLRLAATHALVRVSNTCVCSAQQLRRTKSRHIAASLVPDQCPDIMRRAPYLKPGPPARHGEQH